MKEDKNSLINTYIMCSGLFLILKITDVHRTLASLFLIFTINYVICIYKVYRNKENRSLFRYYGVQASITLITFIYIYTNF